MSGLQHEDRQTQKTLHPAGRCIKLCYQSELNRSLSICHNIPTQLGTTLSSKSTVLCLSMCDKLHVCKKEKILKGLSCSRYSQTYTVIEGGDFLTSIIVTYITLFRSITMFCGTDTISWSIFPYFLHSV